MRVAVIGAGSWATALAVLLSRNGKEVTMWARRQQQIEEMLEYRENRSYLPGVSLPPQLRLTADLELALADAEAVVLGVPSHAVRETIKRVAGFLKPQQHRLIVNTAKGLEEGSFLRLSQVIASELSDVFRDKIVVLSGPSHAEEVGREIPTAVVAAAAKRETAEAAQDLFMSPAFRVYTNPDVVGVELGGGLEKHHCPLYRYFGWTGFWGQHQGCTDDKGSGGDSSSRQFFRCSTFNLCWTGRGW